MSSWSLHYPDLGSALSQGVNSGVQLGQAYLAKQDRDIALQDRRKAEQAQAQAADQADQVKDLQLFKKMGEHLLSVQDNPEMYERAYNSLITTIRKERPDWAANIPDTMLTPDQMAGMMRDVDNMLSGSGVEQPVDKHSAQARAAIANELGRPELAAPGAIEQYAQATGDRSILDKLGQYTRSAGGIQSEEEALALARAKAMRVSNTVNAPVNVNAGNEQLGSNVRNKLQEQEFNLEGQERVLQQQLAMPDSFFGAMAGGKSFLGEAADYLGVPADSTIDFAAERSQALAAAKENNMRLINEAFGASLSEGEKKSAAEVFANPEKYGPAVYKAKVRGLLDLVKSRRARNQKARGQGIAVDRGDEGASINSELDAQIAETQRQIEMMKARLGVR